MEIALPRNIAGTYSAPPGTQASTLTPIGSAAYNAFVDDMVADANAPRPIPAGGSGAGTADAALTNFGGTVTGKAVFTAVDKAAARDAIGAQLPAGAVMHFAMLSAPTGWLKANGATVSRTTYADLFAAIGTLFGAGDGSTTFKLPDLRGEFVRSWDDSRSVDAGRTLGSAQAAAMLDHTHSGTTSSDGSHTHALTGVTGAGATVGIAIDTRAPISAAAYIASAGAHTHTITTGNPSAGGGAETRPRNIALLACIKH